MNIPADAWLVRSDFCAECVPKKLCFPAGVLLHTSLDPHYLRNMCFNTGMGAFQHFCPPPPPPPVAAVLPVFSKAWLGLPFSVGIACSAGLSNYQEQISWWLGEGDDFLWLKGEEVTFRNAEDAFSRLSVAALLFFTCLVETFLIVGEKKAEQSFVSLSSILPSKERSNNTK